MAPQLGFAPIRYLILISGSSKPFSWQKKIDDFNELRRVLEIFVGEVETLNQHNDELAKKNQDQAK